MRPPDLIALEGLEFRGTHGVMPEEAVLGARFVVDVEMEVQVTGTNSLEETVDYSRVYGLVKQLVEGTRYDLIEALAARIARDVLDTEPLVHAVTVRVNKPQAPLPGVFANVYAQVTRDR